MTSWMARLARHYDRVREDHPDDELLIVFDIDGTILDMRYMILDLLKRYDAEEGTNLFQELTLADIKCHENQVDQLLERLHLSGPRRRKVHDWFLAQRWSLSAILKAHHPFAGVMEVIRWFQMQPRTNVALNTGRPTEIRDETLRSLNELAREYRVTFPDELLFMNPAGWDEGVGVSKVAGLEHFRAAGYRIVAMIDNEPANLTALAEADAEGEVLLLHADTIFESARAELPAGAVGGAGYDLTELISERDLPRMVQLVWHGLNDDLNLRQFLASDVEWAEFDVRQAPDAELIVRHDSFEESPLAVGEEFLPLDEVLRRVEQFQKSIKIDLKEDDAVIERVVELVTRMGVARERLWINGHIEILGEEGFRKLAAAFPGAILQCRMDFLVPLIEILPEEGRRILEGLRTWGINRFSLPWGVEHLTRIIDQMDRWGFDINIYNVPDLEAFLKAVLQQPRSVTSDFNFPKWHYYGRGSGENAQRHEYQERV